MGAHVARLLQAPTPALFLLLLILSSCSISFGGLDSDALLKLKDSLGNTSSLRNWDPTVAPPCSGNRRNWVGLLCLNGNIWGLRLDNMGLKGVIDVDALAQLPYLRKLSLRNNYFDGRIPDFRKLLPLKSVFLWNNNFSGQIADDAFVGMSHLKKVYLSNNQFSGRIPSSLAALPRLLELRLDGNRFEGQIPDFQQQMLRVMNVSYNELEGPIPTSISSMGLSSFQGNEHLCGQPLGQCKLKSKKTTPIRNIIIIGIALVLVLLVIALVAVMAYRRSRKSKMPRSLSFNGQNNIKVASYSTSPLSAQKSPESRLSLKKGEIAKLIFVRDVGLRFDLQDLLRASAEVLGSGTFGASYKAVILDGQAMVVKRYMQMNHAGREDFHEHMGRLGRLNHPNLLPLVGYYYRKEEKLLVAEFVKNGSLASHLHGNQKVDQAALDWPTRLKIIKGVVKGLEYLYRELPDLIVPHGHLKSSNVILKESFEPVLTDYALLPVINTNHAQQLMIAYKVPERGLITKKTDVWGLGILILEILTGKFPENFLMQRYERNADLSNFVNAMVKEKRTDEVFDREMEGTTKDCKGKMIELLKIGLRCCEGEVDARPELKEVVEKIEELRETDIDEDHYSISTDSEGNVFTYIDV